MAMLAGKGGGWNYALHPKDTLRATAHGTKSSKRRAGSLHVSLGEGSSWNYPFIVLVQLVQGFTWSHQIGISRKDSRWSCFDSVDGRNPLRTS